MAYIALFVIYMLPHIYIAAVRLVCRNLLVGSVSTNDYEVVPFPGLQELFSVESPSQEVRNEINKHIGDIMTSMVDAMDYSKRAIMDTPIH